MCKFSINASVQKTLQNIFAKIVKAAPFCSTFQRAIKSENPMSGSRFSRVMVK